MFASSDFTSRAALCPPCKLPYAHLPSCHTPTSRAAQSARRDAFAPDAPAPQRRPPPPAPIIGNPRHLASSRDDVACAMPPRVLAMLAPCRVGREPEASDLLRQCVRR